MTDTDDTTSVATTESAGILMATGGITAVVRAEIDMQISTARAYPRRPAIVRKQLVELVTLDDDAAEESMYALPRAGKPVTGPSIRFAEAVKQAWGNCRASAEVSEINKDLKYVEAIGIFHDLETNTVTRLSHRRRISGRNGKVFPDDMIMVTANAACSVAMREAILKGVPKPVWRSAYDAVVKVIAGDVMTLAENREKAIKAFAVYGVKPEQIFQAIGVTGDADVTIDHITVMRGMFSALKNGEETVESMFARRDREPADPDRNPLVKSAGAGANDPISTGGQTHEVNGNTDKGDPRADGTSSAEDRSAAVQQDSQAGAAPATNSAAAEAAHPSGHAAGHQPAAGSDSAATAASQQASASPAPADAGASSSTHKDSPQPDLLSGATTRDGSGQPSDPARQADGAGDSRGEKAPAPTVHPATPERLQSYSKALGTIENGGPPKLAKQSNAWMTKYGAFDPAGSKLAGQILAAHTQRITGEIDMEACLKQVKGVIG